MDGKVTQKIVYAKYLLLTCFLKESVALHIISYRNYRRAKQSLTGFLDVAYNAALCSDSGMVCNLQMSGNAHLTCQDAVFTNFGRACYAAERSHNGVVPYYHVVSNLAEVVNLDSVADDGRFHLCAVYGGTGAYLYVIAYDYVAKVLYLLPGTIGLRYVSETIGPDDCIGVNDDVVPYYHSGINNRSGIEDAVLAYYGILADIYVLVYLGVVAYLCAAAYIRACSKINLLAELGREEPYSAQTAEPAVAFLLGRGPFKQLCNSGIGIVHPDHCGAYRLLWLEVLVYKDYRSLAGINVMLILGVGIKTKFAGLAVFYLGKTFYYYLRVSIDGSPEQFGEILRFNFHYQYCLQRTNLRLYLDFPKCMRIFATVIEIGARPASYFAFIRHHIMTGNQIIEKISEAVAQRNCFIVDVTVSKENDVELIIESEDGTVQMEDCIAIDKAFHLIWDQDVEDYSLTVSSAGLDRPFKVLKQYRKAIGQEVVARLKGGKKFVAVLADADEDSVTLVHGGQEEKVPMAQVNTVAYNIVFE